MSIVSAVAGAMNGRKNAVPNNNDLMLIEALRGDGVKVESGRQHVQTKEGCCTNGHAAMISMRVSRNARCLRSESRIAPSLSCASARKKPVFSPHRTK
jgi:hypothetical protein